MSKTSQGKDAGSMALGGFGQMMGNMDFLKRAWSNLASPFTPTLNVEELDKRISDLRAVEQWLALNQNMLRTTIQGLEIQRGTLDAFNTMTNSFGSAMKPPDDSMAQTLARFAAAAAQKSVTPAAEKAPAATTADSPVGNLFRAFDWSPFGMPSSALAGLQDPSPSKAGGSAEAADPADADADDGDDDSDDDADDDAGGEGEAAETPEGDQAPANEEEVWVSPPPPGKSPKPGTQKAAEPAGAGEAPNLVPGMNPMAWWQMLQDNFRQIAQAATAEASKAASGALAAAGSDSGSEKGSSGGTRRGRAGGSGSGSGSGGGGGGGSSGRGGGGAAGARSAKAKASGKPAGPGAGRGAGAKASGSGTARGKARTGKDKG